MKHDILRGLYVSAKVWMPLGLFVSGILLAIANYCGVGYTNDSHLYIKIAGAIDEQGLY